jgi:hypothetical protein
VSDRSGSPDRTGRLVPPLTGLAVALAVTLPLLGPGFVLTYDMGFVPVPRLSAGLLGMGTAVPRNVPFGLLAALAARVLTGQVVEKLVLLAVFGLAAWGAARLVPAEHPAGRVAAGVLYAWNPFTYERILLGQAAFLLAYAALPWVAAAAIRVRRGEPGSMRRLVVPLGLASFTGPYGGLFAGAVALAVAAAPPRQSGERLGGNAGRVAAASLALNLPWLVPSLLRPGGVPSPDVAFDLFRSRPDTPLGLVGSLASLGGVWRTDLAPPGRDSLAWLPAFLLVVGVAVVGWRRLGRRWPRGALAGLAAAAAAGLILAVGVNAPLMGGPVRWAGRHLPGGGILRDGQKFVAPLALALSVGFGMGVGWLAGLIERRAWRAVAAAGLVVAGAALAPTLAWAAGGELFTARYPPEWDRARAVMADDAQPGAVLVLPWHLHLPFAWNRGRVVIQPATAFFTRPAVVSDALEVGRARVPPEDPWSALADPIVRGGRPLGPSLARLGVRYVLLLKEADWARFTAQVAGLQPVLATKELTLFRSATPVGVPRFPEPPAGTIAIGDGAAAATFAWAILPRRRWDRRAHSRI